MVTVNGFTTGIRNFFRASPFIFKHSLWWVFLIPLMLQIVLYFSGFVLMDYLGNLLGFEIKQWMSEMGNSEFLEKLPTVLIWLVKFLIQVLFFIVFAFINGYIILIVLSPVFAWISERTDQIINGTKFPFNFGQFVFDIWRGILIAIRNLFIEFGISLIVIIIMLLPGINAVSGPVGVLFLFVLSSYFYGFSFMDYTSERRRLKFRESISLVRKYKGMAIANGALFSLTLLIPFCGVSLAGFAAIIATVGATLAMHKIPELSH